MFATRMGDTAFKRVLRTLPIEGKLQLEGPFGMMTLDKEESRPAVLLAGGIGITPFRSMILEAHSGNGRVRYGCSTRTDGRVQMNQTRSEEFSRDDHAVSPAR